MKVAKLLHLHSLGIDKRDYYLHDQRGDIAFEGQNWQGIESRIKLARLGEIEYSLEETSKSIQVDLISDDPTLITDISFGSALSEATIILAYFNEVWKRCPVNFRGLISGVRREGEAIVFDIQSGDIDRDRIYPKIWSHQSQLREFPNDQGFRFLPVLVKKPTRNFLKPISGRE